MTDTRYDAAHIARFFDAYGEREWERLVSSARERVSFEVHRRLLEEHVRAGDRVRIDGWLVNVEAGDGWRWRSSLTREDSGSGACELVYACAISLQ